MRKKITDLINTVGYHFNDRENEVTPLKIIREEAMRESAAFIRERMAEASLFTNTPALRMFAIDGACRSHPAGSLFLEFGVFQGRTLNQFADRMKMRGRSEQIYGFDAFEGLEENWTALDYGDGAFNQDGKMPKVRPNAKLIKGWVQDTVDGFLAEHDGKPIAFAHLDMDTYTPTKYVLERIKPRCVPGTVLLFDELYGYPAWRDHEHKALMEVYSENEFRYLAFGNLQCAIVIR